MSQNKEARDWYEDDQPLVSSETNTSHVPGLPCSWSNYIWWIASLGFAILWVTESLIALDTSKGYGSYSHFAGNIWTMLLVMAICYLVFKLSRPITHGLSYILSGAGALYILLTYTF